MIRDLMTPADHYSDALLKFENFARYCAQSEATEAGKRAELPERPTLSRELSPYTEAQAWAWVVREGLS